ncbi:Transmembrane domain-containing protein [Giardia muris]|uniref:Transmembrane domain-containing protein n=1 Tax=Giardia muris TaxID=5742 RepID=A0A4Z1SPZ9_GIAMU|nr:Transmembrane domain-containing protein [Giardia muris]|eukprot:TNJ26955.1 Transmembrane domain-containing protein [Giardia muris]
MCGSCGDILDVLLVTIPCVAYAVLFGFIPRKPWIVGSALEAATTSNTKFLEYCNPPGIKCDINYPAVWILIILIAVIATAFAIVMLILRWCACCCSCCGCGCCGCCDCLGDCCQALFKIAMGVSCPAFTDGLIYIISAVLLESSSVINNHWVADAFGSYSGLGAVSVASGWIIVFILTISIRPSTCAMRTVVLTCGAVACFIIITSIVAANPRGDYHSGGIDLHSGRRAIGLAVGLVETIDFMLMFGSVMPCWCCGD